MTMSPLNQAWQSLSLSARLMLVSGAALTLLGTMYFTLVVKSEISFHHEDLHERLRYELDFITPALAEPAVVGDYSLIQQMLDVRVKQPNIVHIAWVDNRGNRIESVEDDSHPKAPDWFVRWVDFPRFDRAKDIVVGGQPYGRVELRLTTTPATNKVWASLQDKLEVLLLCIGILFSLTLATVGNALRPLYALGAVARKFGQGDHSVRMTPAGPPEMIACVSAFNSMADNIQNLLLSVREGDARNEMLALIVEQSSVAIITTDLNGIVTSWNAAASELYCYSAEEAIGKSTAMLYTVDRHEEAAHQAAHRTLLNDGGKSVSIETRHVARHGTVLDIFANISPLYGAEGSHIGEIIVIRDITRQKQAEEALFKETERAQVTLASIADAVITTDTQGNVEYLNPVAEKLLGWTSSEAHGQPLDIVFHGINEASGEPIENQIDKLTRDSSTNGVREDAVLAPRAGGEIPIQLTAASISDREGQIIGSVLVFRDVSASHNMARQLTWQATHDALTSLVNRREFGRCLESLAETAEREGREHALLYMDLDQFKVVNDTCGHLAGDELLRQLSALLNNRVRASDTLARLGGDEFGVLLKDCKEKQALELAETLRATVAEFRFAWQDKLFTVGVSIGVVSIKGGGANNADLLALADAACYQAKDKGRNRVEAAPQDKEMAHGRSEMLWVSKIHTALEQDRLILHCQRISPIVAGGRPHYEVLLRMRDDEGNLIMPMAFIPAAERYNMMQIIDRKVITMVFEMLEKRAWDGRPENLMTMSINLSGISLSDEHLLDFLRQQFRRYKVHPREICFEITETAAIANLMQAVVLIKELKAMGCRFSLDDFGSGLSSFAYLKNLPVDYLKIDGSFVRDMAHDPIDAAMVQAISNIGHVMGIQTIAEWVEDEVTLGMLKKIGVDYAQGYLIARPEPIEQVMWAAAPIAAFTSIDEAA